MYEMSVLSVDLMQPPGCFMGEQLNGSACLPARSGVADDEWTNSGLCPGVDSFPGLYNVTLERT